MVIDLRDPAATEAAGAQLSAQLRAGDVIALSGVLGAGKTSFARGVLRGLGLGEEAPSPTFGIVIPYEPPAVRVPVWHIDLYRLNDFGDTVELGLDDARRDTVLLIEWPDRLGARLWADALAITIERTKDDARRLTASIPPSWEGRCRFQ